MRKPFLRVRASGLWLIFETFLGHQRVAGSADHSEVACVNTVLARATKRTEAKEGVRVQVTEFTSGEPIPCLNDV